MTVINFISNLPIIVLYYWQQKNITKKIKKMPVPDVATINIPGNIPETEQKTEQNPKLEQQMDQEQKTEQKQNLDPELEPNITNKI